MLKHVSRRAILMQRMNQGRRSLRMVVYMQLIRDSMKGELTCAAEQMLRHGE